MDAETTDPRCLNDLTGGGQGSTIAVLSRHPSPPTAPPPSPPGAFQDPHIHFAHGGRADFRGRHRQLYNFFSAPGLSVSLRTENCTFPLGGEDPPRLIVDGSFITEVHLVVRVGANKSKWANISYWSSELNEDNWGWKVVNGSCDGRRTKLGKGGFKRCEDLDIQVHMSHATFSAGNWSIEVRGMPTHAFAGPEHRLDVSFFVKGDFAARNLPHGIFGQSYSSLTPRYGKVDVYPESGRFTTVAMAEGAIDGTAEMYEMSSPFATEFAYSRFSRAQERDDQLRKELIGTSSASAVDDVSSAPPPPLGEGPRAASSMVALVAAAAPTSASLEGRLSLLEMRLGVAEGRSKPPALRLRALEAFADITPRLPALGARLQALEGWLATTGF